MSDEMPLYLDGPRFCQFLESRGISRYDLTESQQRRWHDWEAGGRASIYDSAGDILTEYMIGERCLPENIWADDQRRSGRADKGRSAEDQKKIRIAGKQMIAQGVSIKEIASELDVTETTVRGWRRKMENETVEEVEKEVPVGYEGLKKQGKVWVRA